MPPRLIPPPEAAHSAASQPRFAELCAQSCFSFLRGASHPEEIIEHAGKLGLHALGLVDLDGLYGIARAHAATQHHDVQLIVGATLTLEETRSPSPPGSGARLIPG